MPPVAPQRTPSDLNSAKTPARIRVVAEELKRVTSRATETYTVYGVTETLFKECASQVTYSIPQSSDPAAEMPKTEDGEDLGVGSGWWHSGKASPPPDGQFQTKHVL
jgi:cytochrome b pre-mRNA-processing protein 3